MTGKAKTFATFIAFNIVVVATIVLLCEGLSSLILLAQNASLTPPVAERQHTRYDPDLGWAGAPNINLPDMYGPGIGLQTNSQGFRSDKTFNAAPPAGQQRLICSGDSFTLGYGVDNYNNWCALLDSINPGWQTVNMGQGGYGIDQAYLWYRRDGAPLAHNIHLFTFITDDFERMQRAEFLGYGKPLLQLRDDSLAVTNVPVPRRAFYAPWLTQNSELLSQLKIVQLMTRLFRPDDTVASPPPGNSDPAQIVAKIIEDLQRLNQQKGSTLILVYLPTWADYDPATAGKTDQWRQTIGQIAAANNIPFFDLVEDFRRLPADSLYLLFIPEGNTHFPQAAGHYSVRGNEFIAQTLYDRLQGSRGAE
ncbi:MAG: hypothetical protein Kow0031_38870 [Anaerolineae bacterium]